MSNTVNGVAAITSDSNRERVHIDFRGFEQALEPGLLLRARLYIDTTGNFTVDNPTIFSDYYNTSGNSQNRCIFIVGMMYELAASGTLTISSQVGSGSVITLETYPLPANGGIIKPISNHELLSPTDAGGKLLINCSNVSGAAPATFTIYYQIATRYFFK